MILLRNGLPLLLILILPMLAIVCPVGAARGDDGKGPVLVGECQKLRPPAGSRLVLHAFGKGVQVFRWSGQSWVFLAPEALLLADPGDDDEIAIHFGGPTWQSNSGSRVVGAVQQSCTPDPGAIPWLLLRAVVNEGPGIFEHISDIQRLNTEGGKAPAEPVAFVGEVASVPYTADYLFHRSPH